MTVTKGNCFAFRQASFSYVRSIKSILEIHNESGSSVYCYGCSACADTFISANIWSHLVGAGQFLFGLLQFIRIQSLAEDGVRVQDVVAVSLYYFCVVVCFVLSTIFHTFSDHSADMHRFGNELDHLGIVLVMWGTGISGTYFGFYCNPSLRYLYLFAISTTALGCAIFTLRPKFRQPSYRTTRFLMYCFLGGSLFAPVLHGSFKYGLTALDDMMGLKSFFGLALINFSGAAIYAARIPERWYPGTFDLLGQSHNWMHVLVFTGALVRLSGLLAVCELWQKDQGAYGMCQSLE